MKRILLVNKEDHYTELSVNDEVVWSGFLEDSDTLQDILESLNFEVERVDYSVDNENLDQAEEEEFFDPYKDTE